ncbi:hypothetical protein GJ496_007179 [Pomphorhynchus laevis]|nr:hypothetical protein GJ496_007179 [Pomphorhynchus laevis]
MLRRKILQLNNFFQRNHNQAIEQSIITLNRANLDKLENSILKTNSFKYTTKDIPFWVQNAMINLSADMPSKTISHDARLLANIIEKEDKISEQYKDRLENGLSTTKEIVNSKLLSIAQGRERKVDKQIKSSQLQVYNEYSALLYLLNMSLRKYNLLCKIFQEISCKHDGFKPLHILDYNAGVGSTTWAANEVWRETIKSTVNCEDSKHLSQLCQRVHKANPEIQKFPSFIYRRLAIPSNQTFDLVVSAYFLNSLQSSGQLKTLIRDLSNCVATGGYAVFIASSASRQIFKSLLQIRQQLFKQNFVIISPCPHDLKCPAIESNAICKFTGKVKVPVLDNLHNQNAIDEEFTYSYLVLQKCSDETSYRTKYPRLISSTKHNTLKSQRAISRILCFPDGNLCNINCTLKHNSNLHQLLRSRNSQDELPIKKKSRKS